LRCPEARQRSHFKVAAKKFTPAEFISTHPLKACGGNPGRGLWVEKHFIRGLQKMKLRCALALIVMLAVAVGRIREKQGINRKSPVKAA